MRRKTRNVKLITHDVHARDTGYYPVSDFAKEILGLSDEIVLSETQLKHLYVGDFRGQAIAHEIGHVMLKHKDLSDPYDSFVQEVAAWHYAMQKGLRFNPENVRRALTSYAGRLYGADREDATASIEALLNKFKSQWQRGNPLVKYTNEGFSYTQPGKEIRLKGGKDSKTKGFIALAKTKYKPESFGHELAHVQLGHKLPRPSDEYKIFVEELAAWELAIRKGLRFDPHFVKHCLSTYANDIPETDKHNDAMDAINELLRLHKDKWKKQIKLPGSKPLTTSKPKWPAWMTANPILKMGELGKSYYNAPFDDYPGEIYLSNSEIRRYFKGDAKGEVLAHEIAHQQLGHHGGLFSSSYNNFVDELAAWHLAMQKGLRFHPENVRVALMSYATAIHSQPNRDDAIKSIDELIKKFKKQAITGKRNPLIKYDTYSYVDPRIFQLKSGEKVKGLIGIEKTEHSAATLAHEIAHVQLGHHKIKKPKDEYSLFVKELAAWTLALSRGIKFDPTDVGDSLNSYAGNISNEDQYYDAITSINALLNMYKNNWIKPNPIVKLDPKEGYWDYSTINRLKSGGVIRGEIAIQTGRGWTKHQAETAAHEIAHYSLGHKGRADTRYKTFVQELAAWHLAMQRGLKFDPVYVKSLLMTYTANNQDVEGINSIDALLYKFRKQWTGSHPPNQKTVKPVNTLVYEYERDNPRDYPYMTDWLAEKKAISGTPDQRKAKYELARALGANASWARAMRDWPPTKIFRRFGLETPPLEVRKQAGLQNPIPAEDKNFLLKALKKLNIDKVAVAKSDSKKTYPDIWVEKNPAPICPKCHVHMVLEKYYHCPGCGRTENPISTPVITVTDEYLKQDTAERHKRLTHELLHLKGLEHNDKIGYNTHPEKDTLSKKVYNKIK